MGIFSWFKRISNDQALLELEETMEQYALESAQEADSNEVAIRAILEGHANSQKEIFETFVAKTIGHHLHSLYQYQVRCTLLGVDKVLIRVASSDTIAFVDNESDELKFYYLEPRSAEKNEDGIQVIPDRDFYVVNDFTELLKDYINTLHSQDSLFLKVKAMMDEHG